jgi:hypothetical protein
VAPIEKLADVAVNAALDVTLLVTAGRRSRPSA